MHQLKQITGVLLLLGVTAGVVIAQFYVEPLRLVIAAISEYGTYTLAGVFIIGIAVAIYHDTQSKRQS